MYECISCVSFLWVSALVCSLFFFKVMERRERRDSGFSSAPLPPPPRVSSAGSVSGARPGEVRTNRMEKQRDTSITSTKVEGGEREGGEREREGENGGRGREGGCEQNGYYSNHALFRSVLLNCLSLPSPHSLLRSLPLHLGRRFQSTCAQEQWHRGGRKWRQGGRCVFAPLPTPPPICYHTHRQI